MRLVVSVCVVLAAGIATDAAITVATNALQATLRVDRAGNAEVSRTSAGRRRYLLVPPRGRFYPGRRLAGPDVSRAVATPQLPYQQALRRTPDGRLWALQAWRVGNSGVATFQGRPVTGFSPTKAGTPIRLVAFFDCLGCGASSWLRFTARRTASDGSFGITVPLERRGQRYRVSITGPNRGTTLAPDVSAVVDTSLAGG